MRANVRVRRGIRVEVTPHTQPFEVVPAVGALEMCLSHGRRLCPGQIEIRLRLETIHGQTDALRSLGMPELLIRGAATVRDDDHSHLAAPKGRRPIHIGLS